MININKLKEPGFIKYFINTSWLLGEKILRIFSALFIGIWLARYLGVENFGLYSYAISFVGLFAVIGNLGLDAILVKEIIQNENDKDKIISTALWIKFITAIILVIVIYSILYFLDTNKITLSLIIVISLSIVFHSFNIINPYFEAKVLSKYIVYVNSFSIIISSLTKVSLILIGADIIYFAWTLVLDSLILAIGYIYVYFYNKNFIYFNKFDFLYGIKLIKNSFPLMLSGFFFTVYMKIDQIMIKEILDVKSVGLYAAATTLSESWYFVPAVICTSLFPAIINVTKNKVLYKERIQKLYDLMVYIGILISIPTIFISYWLVETLYGIEYILAANVLIIHIWAGLFIGLIIASGKWIVNENLYKHALYRNIIGALVNIILNYFLIMEYGIIGAAYATLISYIIAGLIYDYFVPDLRSNFYFKLNALTLMTLRKKIYKKEN